MLVLSAEKCWKLTAEKCMFLIAFYNPEKQENGRILKQLHLGFPVFYEGSEGDTIRLHEKNTLESVVGLKRVGDEA